MAPTAPYLPQPWFAGQWKQGMLSSNPPAPEEVVGGIKIWIEENYLQFRLTVGRPKEGRRSFDTFGEPPTGVIRASFLAPDPIFGQRPMQAVLIDIGCWAQYLEIEEFIVEYDDQEFFEKISEVLDWILEGHKVRELLIDPSDDLDLYPTHCKRFRVNVLENSLRRLIALPKGVPRVKCRGPPYSKAGTRQDDVTLAR